ncbi:TPA: GNAT family protein [Escherichia coli]|uniref:GNAT family N-acetyltransferase n=2 Tax=Pseudomonadaceae TaxID=135621 RepID=A0AAW7DXA3_9GAMM|nr:N-acetyltransferase [Salmonella enterica]EBK2417207.1 GNAT family N-acetyltransferase [Salmonella enterica subsp. enterica serovar Kentucky]EBL6408271.1 GNAT family N-acetyltransferase [Salmonella enterica subsp. enterica serovar Mbandaka]EBM9764728.1 GNAT family N-acetyltransferase [Salmonella enterica subsp. enterica serovar Heidelberg]EBV9331487.1 N-acetyltransferase [Salmonella enterica subsp. enterica serovar Typhimurium var. 5-]ECC3526975.1 N-acetyltransferase [Salmonella enterica sub
MEYWLDQHKTGKGYATAALRALIGHAKNALTASDLYAGVTHGNARSVALLARAGFSPVADFEKYTRYHLPLIS